MRVLLIILFSVLFFNISSAQSGWGYVNYTSYRTHNGNGSTNQYGAFPNTKAEFDNMLNTTNSNTTITHTGETTILNLYNGSLQTPRWSNDFFAYKFEFWFIPQQTGLYYFGINSDDASDLLVDDNVLVSFYGGHGAYGYQVVGMNMVAGQRYKMVFRGQEYGGGEAFYFQWYRPVGGWGYWTNEVTNIGIEPTKKAQMNFDFGSTLDETKFSIGSALSSTGWVNATNQLDSNKISNGIKATTSVGQVEWAIINPYDASLGGHQLLIDQREFDGTGVSPNDVKSIKLFDIYDGPVTVNNISGWWKIYVMPGNLTNKIISSSFQSQLRLQDGWYGTSAEFTFVNNMEYKPQTVTMTTTNNLTTLYNSIVTVSDVYMAFKELANGGIFGNQTGNEFTYGIQYKNADIDDNGIFNEADCFALLQHLTGKKNLVDTFNLRKTLKLMPQTTYNSIGKTNWATFPSYLGDKYNFDINTGKGIDTFYIKGTWKGDINLSHSATPPSNGVTTNSANFGMKSQSITSFAYVISEIVGDSLITIVKFNPNGNEIVAVQFQLNYDNTMLKYGGTQFKTIGTPTNFDSDGNEYINLGSLNTDGKTLDSTTEYKITFKINKQISNSLGLVSIATNEAVTKTGGSVKIRIE